MTKLPLLSTPNVCLLSQAELADDGTVSLDVRLLEIAKEISSVTDHLLKSAAAVEVLLVGLQVRGQIGDASGQNCDLHLGRTCVTLMGSIGFDQAQLFFLLHGNFHLS